MPRLHAEVTHVRSVGSGDRGDTQPVFRDIVDYWHFDGTSWTDQAMPPSAATFMFPEPGAALGSFVFGPHDRWIVGLLGTWERNTR